MHGADRAACRRLSDLTHPNHSHAPKLNQMQILPDTDRLNAGITFDYPFRASLHLDRPDSGAGGAAWPSPHGVFYDRTLRGAARSMRGHLYVKGDKEEWDGGPFVGFSHGTSMKMPYDRLLPNRTASLSIVPVLGSRPNLGVWC